MEHLRKALTYCKYPNGLWTGWRKGLPSQPVSLVMWLTTRALGHYRCPTHYQWSQNNCHTVIQGTCKILGMLNPPNLTPPCNFSQVLWSMLREHPCLSMHIEPPRTYIRHWISVLLQTWWSPTVGYMKASLITTNVLFQRIYKLLDVPLHIYTVLELLEKHHCLISIVLSCIGLL